MGSPAPTAGSSHQFDGFRRGEQRGSETACSAVSWSETSLPRAGIVKISNQSGIEAILRVQSSGQAGILRDA